MEAMGVASGCGCKVVYRFLIIIYYPYSSCICSFLLYTASLFFVHFKNVFRSLYIPTVIGVKYPGIYHSAGTTSSWLHVFQMV